MDWQLCLKPASVRPQDLCELNVNAALEMLCKGIERMERMAERQREERRWKTRGRKEDGGTDPIYKT